MCVLTGHRNPMMMPFPGKKITRKLHPGGHPEVVWVDKGKLTFIIQVDILI